MFFLLLTIWLFRWAKNNPRKIVVGLTTSVLFVVIFNLIVHAFFLDPRKELRTSDAFFFNLTDRIFVLTRGYEETVDAMVHVIQNDPNSWSVSNICKWGVERQEEAVLSSCEERRRD